MTRFNTILLLLLIGCALSVVTSQHQARKLFMELQTEQDAERKLDNEWRELQIESQTQDNGKRIEQKATRDLGMSQPDPKKTVIVVLDSSVASNAAVSGPENKKPDQAVPHASPVPEARVRNGARETLAPSKDAGARK